MYSRRPTGIMARRGALGNVGSLGVAAAQWRRGLASTSLVAGSGGMI